MNTSFGRPIGRRHGVCGLILGLAVLALSCSSSEDGTAPSTTARASGTPLAERHLLLVTIDTLRADRLGAYGHEAAQTPNLDRLARGGVRFENAYSSVPLTLPSHGVLFTGRYPFAISVRTNGSYVLPEAETTLAERFAADGFATSAVVASYVLSAKFGIAQGFAHYDDALGSAPLLRTFTSEIGADEVYRRFSRWYEQQADLGDRRQFSWIHFYDPHLPYTPPTDLPNAPPDPYDGEIAYVDQQIGKILDLLERHGQLERTTVVVTSDHGEGFGEHLEIGHGLLAYEESLRVPLIVHAEGALRPAVRSERVGLVDLAPTLLELYGLDAIENTQGRSFATLLHGDVPSTSPSPLYFESLLGQEDKNWAPLTGLLDEPYKYIALPEPELYNLEDDPGETRNLFDTERRVLRRLDEQLKQVLLERPGADEGPRELSDEDRRHLESLGYLTSSGRAKETLDPKRGIRIDRTLGEVRSLLDRGEPRGASARLDQIRAEHPGVEMPTFFFLRHEIQVAEGQADEALATLAAGMDAFPDLEQFPFQRASYLVDLGRYDEAEAMCQRLLQRNPRFSQAWILRGKSAEARGQLGEALVAYRQALTIEPQNTALRLRVADATARSGDLPGALQLYEELDGSGALEGRAEELYKLAVLHSQTGNFSRAESLFRRGLEVAPAGLHRLSLALILDRNQKRAEAEIELERVLDEHASELTPQQASLARATLEQWRQQ